MYADRTSTAAIALSGGAQASVNGGVYAADAAVSATGNAILSVAGPLVASAAAVTGSAKIAETASPSAPAQPTTSTIGYSYNGLGQVSGVTYADGHAVSRAYDPTGRLSSVTDWSGNTIQFGYDGDGNLVSTTYPGGVVDITTPDAADRPATITTTRSGTSLAKFGYIYTPGGLLASTTDSLTGQSPQTFGHNTLTQLTDVGGQPSAYSYDAGDNITTLDDGTKLTYDPANQLTGLTKPGGQTEAFGYDQVGDRTTQTGSASATYGYDEARRLVSTQTAAGSATYSYNGDGLRVGEKTTASQVGLTWDVNATLPMLFSDATNDYIYGPTDNPVEQVDRTTGNVVFLHADRLGSVRALTDTTGALVGTASYGPYGAAAAHTGATTPFGYAGQYTDTSGLIYLRARYYDPATAQFLTVDPAYDRTGARYSYANGDPLDQTDISGLYPTPSGPDGGCFYSNNGCSTGGSGAGACPTGTTTIEGSSGPICAPEPSPGPPVTTPAPQPVKQTQRKTRPKDVCPGPPKFPGNFSVEDPTPIKFHFSGEYGDVDYELTYEFSASITIEGGVDSLPTFKAGNKKVGISLSDARGNAVKVSQDWTEDSVAMEVQLGKGPTAQLGTETVSLHGAFTTEGLKLKGTVKGSVPEDGQTYELENSVTATVSAKVKAGSKQKQAAVDILGNTYSVHPNLVVHECVYSVFGSYCT